MTKLITVEKAKKEILRLTYYVDLVESYDTTTLKKWIIREYAHTNSLVEVVRRAKDMGYTNEGININKGFVLSVINSKPHDELHKILRTGYKLKIRPNKRKY